MTCGMAVHDVGLRGGLRLQGAVVPAGRQIAGIGTGPTASPADAGAGEG